LTSWASQSSCTDFGCGNWFWVVFLRDFYTTLNNVR
jgi:hypothetical protein